MPKLKDYIKALEEKSLVISADVPSEALEKEITELTYDSRRVVKDALFVCKGLHFIPEFAVSAAVKGAAAYVSEREYECSAPAIIVSDIRLAMPILAKLFFCDAPSSLFSVGITGTKGKSTVAYMIRSVLRLEAEKSGKPSPAVLSSIENYDGVICEESHLTTDEAIELHRHFANARESGIKRLVMEVSSQALKYHRTDGITYGIGCFTNIGTDHISPSEHPDFEDYFASKKLLFSQCETAVICLDDKNASETVAAATACGCRVVGYSRQGKGDVYAENIRTSGCSTFFDASVFGKKSSFEIGMPGIFNVSNALCAIAVCSLLGVDESTIAEGIRLARADGRMEVFSSADGEIVAIVDYAHNAMSFDALFSSAASEYPDRNIIAVFGCPGKKAFQRRRDLPEIASKYCSKIYFAEEDSGEEPFSSIVADLEKYASCPYEKIEDRTQAIRSAVFSDTGKRLLLITGKGRERSMKRGNAYQDCPSDVDCVTKYISEYDASVKYGNAKIGDR